MTTYWTLGSDIAVSWLDGGLAGLKVSDDGDLVIIGETIELDDDEEFGDWTKEAIAVVSQQVLFAIKGRSVSYYIDENIDIQFTAGDFSDPNFGTKIGSIIGNQFTEDDIPVLRLDIETAVLKLQQVESAVVTDIIYERGQLRIDLQVTLIKSNSVLQLSVEI